MLVGASTPGRGDRQRVRGRGRSARLELLTGVCVTGMFTLWETSHAGAHPDARAVAGLELRLPDQRRRDPARQRAGRPRQRGRRAARDTVRHERGRRRRRLVIASVPSVRHLPRGTQAAARLRLVTFISPSSDHSVPGTSKLTIRGVSARYGGRVCCAFLKCSDCTCAPPASPSRNASTSTNSCSSSRLRDQSNHRQPSSARVASVKSRAIWPSCRRARAGRGTSR